MDYQLKLDWERGRYFSSAGCYREATTKCVVTTSSRLLDFSMSSCNRTSMHVEQHELIGGAFRRH